jgi:hypothetical protein
MLLGTLMTQLGRPERAAETLITLGDLVLVAEVEAMAAAGGETVADYAAAAVERFASAADDEAWLTLVGRLERADDPAGVFLSHALRFALERDRLPLEPAATTCGCGGGAGGCHGHP